MERLRLASSNSAFLLVALLLMAAVRTATAADPDYPRRIEVLGPKAPVPEGTPFFVTVRSTSDIATVEGAFGGREVLFFPDGGGESGFKRFTALMGVEDGTGDQGKSEVRIRACMEGGAAAPCFTRKLTVRVKAGDFPSEILRVPPRTVRPTAKDKLQIARDAKALNRVYSRRTRQRLWDPPALLPVASEVTSIWGTRRIYNGIKQGAHYGTDLRAPTGTPILAALTGRVAMAQWLFFTGYTVILDHGYGLFTIHGHLSKLKVKEGTLARKGALLGLAGATGRASGAHLHWAVNLHGIKVDPMAMVKVLGGPSPAVTDRSISAAQKPAMESKIR